MPRPRTPARSRKSSSSSTASSSAKRSRKSVSTAAAAAAAETPDIHFEHIDLEGEFAVLRNNSDAPANLEGCYFADMTGGNVSRPLERIIIPGKATFKFWTAPGGRYGPKDVTEDEKNVFWRNKSGKPRTKAVLNNEEDGLIMYGAQDSLVHKASVAEFIQQEAREDKEEEDVQEDDDEEEEDEAGAANTSGYIGKYTKLTREGHLDNILTTTSKITTTKTTTSTRSSGFFSRTEDEEDIFKRYVQRLHVVERETLTTFLQVEH